MPNGYVVSFNNLDFIFSSSELSDMDDFIQILDGHLIGHAEVLHEIVIKPLFTN